MCQRIPLSRRTTGCLLRFTHYCDTEGFFVREEERVLDSSEKCRSSLLARETGRPTLTQSAYGRQTHRRYCHPRWQIEGPPSNIAISPILNAKHSVLVSFERKIHVRVISRVEKDGLICQESICVRNRVLYYIILL